MVVLTEASQTLTFTNVDAEPVPSLLRGFSAPVVLDFDYSDAQLLTLLAHVRLDADDEQVMEAEMAALHAVDAVADRSVRR